ncbi:MAG: hydrolase [Gemmatimonadota bacterium]|nr:hydrolase [Gemmatimonadota bacterium]
MRHKEMLDREKTCLLVVDVQARLLPVIHGSGPMVENIRRLAQGAKILGLPIVLTEQYPRGLGHTVEPVAEVLGDGITAYEKTTFSCLADKPLARAVADTGCDTLLVCGVESHVCVSQTVLDAIAAGLKVQVAADAVSSRNPENKRLALERLARAGAVITSTEAALFELLERSGTEEFKKVSALVK